MKTVFISLTALSLCVLYSCNEQEKKERETITADTSSAKVSPDTTVKNLAFSKNCNGTGNLLVREGEADTMKKDFAKYYAVKNPKLISCSVWIDKLVMQALVDHFTKYNCDGVRFYNAIDPKTSATTLIMVPTKYDASAAADKSKHANNWTKINISSGHPYVYKQHSLGENATKDASNLFETTYGSKKPSDNKLLFSSSVWISECVFRDLLDVLNAQNSEFDGIRVWQGAYHDMDSNTRPSQDSLRQSTVILVPTFPLGGAHKDDWTILQNYVSSAAKVAGGGYNHGELCPKICP